MNKDVTSSPKEAASSQKERLFMRGKAMSGAPYQRHHPVAEPSHRRRHDHEENHDQTMGGDEHVEHFGVAEDLQTRTHQLKAHAHGEQTADNSPHQRKGEVHRADVLVVGRIEPAPPAMRMIIRMGGIGICFMCHQCSPISAPGSPTSGNSLHFRVAACRN